MNVSVIFNRMHECLKKWRVNSLPILLVNVSGNVVFDETT